MYLIIITIIILIGKRIFHPLVTHKLIYFFFKKGTIAAQFDRHNRKLRRLETKLHKQARIIKKLKEDLEKSNLQNARIEEALEKIEKDTKKTGCKFPISFLLSLCFPFDLFIYWHAHSVIFKLHHQQSHNYFHSR